MPAKKRGKRRSKSPAGSSRGSSGSKSSKTPLKGVPKFKGQGTSGKGGKTSADANAKLWISQDAKREALAKLTHSERKVLSAHFYEFAGEDEKLNRTEFKKLAARIRRRAGRELTAQLKHVEEQVFYEMAGKDELIDIDEYMSILAVRLHGEPMDVLKWYYRIHDSNENGVLEREEILSFVQMFVEERVATAIEGRRGMYKGTLIPMIVDWIMVNLDQNGDGVIDWAEFRPWAWKHLELCRTGMRLLPRDLHVKHLYNATVEDDVPDMEDDDPVDEKRPEEKKTLLSGWGKTKARPREENALLSYDVSPKEKKRFYNRFRKLASEDNEIDRAEFNQLFSYDDAMTGTGHASNFEGTRLFDLMDTDKSGKLSFKEILDWRHKYLNGNFRERLGFLADLYDKDGSGNLGRDEVYKLLCTLDSKPHPGYEVEAESKSPSTLKAFVDHLFDKAPGSHAAAEKMRAAGPDAVSKLSARPAPPPKPVKASDKLTKEDFVEGLGRYHDFEPVIHDLLSTIYDQYREERKMSKGSGVEKTDWSLLGWLFLLIVMRAVGFVEWPGILYSSLPAELNVDYSDYSLFVFLPELIGSILLLPIAGGIVTRAGPVRTMSVLSSIVFAAALVMAFAYNLTASPLQFPLMLFARILSSAGFEIFSVAIAVQMTRIMPMKGFPFAMAMRKTSASLVKVISRVAIAAIPTSLFFNFYLPIAGLLLLAGPLAMEIIEATRSKRRKTKPPPFDAMLVKQFFTVHTLKISKVPGTIWLLFLIAALHGALWSYTIVLPFILESTFGFTKLSSNVVTTLPFLITMIGGPFMGAAIGKFGKVTLFLSVSGACATGGFMLMSGLIPGVAVPGVILYSVAFAILEIAVPIVVPRILADKPDLQATGFALVKSVFMLGVAIMTQIVSSLFESPNVGVQGANVFFVGVAALLIFAVLAIKVVDARHGSKLDKDDSKTYQDHPVAHLLGETAAGFD